MNKTYNGNFLFPINTSRGINMKNLSYSLILFVSFLSATIINVPDDYSTIQAGINASDNGDTVLIAQGIYFENLILQKEIVLTSHAIYD